jgi:hypothetical protein
MKATGIIPYDTACRAIAECYSVDAVKDWRDKAKALHVYAQQAQNVELENRALKIRLRAERRAGQLLKETDSAQGKRTDLVGSNDQVKTLSDMGISKGQSSDWQRLAEYSDKEFNAVLNSDNKPSTKKLAEAKRVKKSSSNPHAAKALWIWGRIKDFERHGILDMDVWDVWENMEPFMREDVLRIAPDLVKWLNKLRR